MEISYVKYVRIKIIRQISPYLCTQNKLFIKKYLFYHNYGT